MDQKMDVISVAMTHKTYSMEQKQMINNITYIRIILGHLRDSKCKMICTQICTCASILIYIAMMYIPSCCNDR